MTNVKITAATDLPIYGWMSASVEIDVMKDKVATFVNAHNYVLKVKGEKAYNTTAMALPTAS